MTDGTPFSLGIEEEYLLVDATSFDLAEAPEAMIRECKHRLGDRVSPEFLRCQIEVGTRVCTSIAEAGGELRHLRAVIADVARAHGLTPISAACHPTARWSDQTHRNRERYNQLREELAAVGDRMLICGMHVHVGLPDPDQRIDVMNQLSWFLPHLLALSSSSPFWQGQDTGLASYRIGVFDALPRTGLPPRFDSWSAYRRFADTLIGAGLIEDASKIWWDLRPSDKFPTIETRICEAYPDVEWTLTLAAAIQATSRFLWRSHARKHSWRSYDNALIGENRWRARRYGTEGGLVDFGAGAIKSMDQLVEEWIALIAEDAEALGCLAEVERLRRMLTDGTSAERQRRVHEDALAAGKDSDAAFREVVRDLAARFTE
ncbi:carboxylate-amine ligase [Palleronia marisminoris]|uniref:Putative glutamate--cysteine ligase 2 n=1 Tax=Palleronia marisminoris TaxID=315423 RepID=A0A1Y5SQH5_9RHOB|nr:carboxylate-amine ligase [Palleronia marisminoris]SFG94020.1 carboxylate-amine ligase [Palleronia marisminoris]SLN45950.1 Carboxylate-amine ligase YbdK [Palleronia marisminoris]